MTQWTSRTKCLLLWPQRISHLARLRLILSVSGSSALSERVFSLANLIVHNLLDYNTQVEQVTCRGHGADLVFNFVASNVANAVAVAAESRKRKVGGGGAQQPQREGVLELPQEPNAAEND